MKLKFVFVFTLMILAFLTTGCEKEGAAEKAGKALDQALDSAKDKINEAAK